MSHGKPRFRPRISTVPPGRQNESAGFLGHPSIEMLGYYRKSLLDKKTTVIINVFPVVKSSKLENVDYNLISAHERDK
jgi:hypothetical protein